ncbi:hypothetical protein [Tenacibaculum sp. MAR_2009_124]|uniref:hypothetical protein n=1 Tax=Tenacibaculum sp. MAR_2009_124 TaxID=1250059 RepID=UPI00115FD2F5|nr:hypothetical protein [Tenacibaculum sp. MAR_2009_124]
MMINQIRKLNFTLLLILVSIKSFGQYSEYAIDGSEFNSVFQNVESGSFKGTVNGILIIKDSENKKTLLDFQGSYAKLEIEKDEHEVYDVSYKKYFGKTTSGKSGIEYQTYGSANSLSIRFRGGLYELSLIDGACDLIINGLEYSYKSEKSAEYLILRITKEIKLDKNHEESIKLLPDSTLIFAIQRN